MSAQNNTQRVFILVIVAVFFLTSVAITASVIIDAAKKDKPAATNTQSEDLQKQLDALQQQTNQPSAEGGTVESTDIVAGTGAEAVAGKSVTVNYVGTLKDGTKFDSSFDRNEPFTFNLGAGQVIKGWDQGVVGMKVGGKRKLVIPAALAYGEQSPSPAIPANSDLVFEIDLLNVQ
ncbi:MAG: FKBP-type peptidyl-prolyl cis-trans isomerase [Candidatus Saccharimonadales bacterium]